MATREAQSVIERDLRMVRADLPILKGFLDEIASAVRERPEIASTLRAVIRYVHRRQMNLIDIDELRRHACGVNDQDAIASLASTIKTYDTNLDQILEFQPETSTT